MSIILKMPSTSRLRIGRAGRSGAGRSAVGRWAVGRSGVGRSRRAGSALLVGVSVGCAVLGLPGGPASARTARSEATERPAARLRVVASFYPVAFVAERVGGRRVVVTNLTPAGAEPHDLELTPRQRDQIEDADLVVVMGEGFQPAVEDAARARGGRTIRLLDALARDLVTAGGASVRRGVTADAHARSDPHVWLDPHLMGRIVDEVTAALGRSAPARRAEFARNATALESELEILDDEFRSGLADCDRRVLVTAHEAFGYLAAAYGLRQEGVAGISPDAEPDARRLAELTDLVEREGVTTVFTESLVSPRVARTLAREAGVRTAVLNPIEGLNEREVRRAASYFTVMRSNLARLRAALGCV